MKSPAITTLMPKFTNLYMPNVQSLEEATRPNLKKTLKGIIIILMFIFLNLRNFVFFLKKIFRTRFEKWTRSLCSGCNYSDNFNFRLTFNVAYGIESSDVVLYLLWFNKRTGM